MNSDLRIVYKEACLCEACELCHSRTNIVFGSGSETPRVMLVGEAPGENEDLSGEPFVGRAGKLLNMLLIEAGISKEDVYITNILKCRPPKNRDPKPCEADCCMPFLNRQIEILNPRVIVCLGRISAMRLINPKFKISCERGIWFLRDGRDICAVYHPSFILRDPRKHDDMLGDLIKIREKIESTD